MNARDRKRRDLRSLLGALLLLAAVVAGWWWLSSRSEEVRQEALLGVPEFPKPGQLPTHRETDEKPTVRPVLKFVDAGTARIERKRDRFNAFALAPAHTVTVVQVNALFNTPLFERFRECAPRELKMAEKAASEKGINLEQDIDRVAMISGGMAMSGFFEGKPVAESFARRGGAEPAISTYRDQTIYQGPGGSCSVQLGNLVLLGRKDGCQALIDRALDPPPEGDGNGDAENELYGDLYMRSDLSGLPTDRGGSAPGPFDQLFSSLSGVTVRANVWDDVAVSFEGSPQDPDKLRDLTQMARGAMSVAKGQLGEDDDKLQALADLAQVQSGDGKLKVDLALPADELFSRLHIPCPGRSDAGPGEPDGSD